MFPAQMGSATRTGTGHCRRGGIAPEGCFQAPPSRQALAGTANVRLIAARIPCNAAQSPSPIQSRQ